MAEERLIDDDKDRKYKIRINENGEEELIIDESEPAPVEETVDFEVPEFETDDEDAAVMTPEQLAAREAARKEEAERRANLLRTCLDEAEKMISKGDFSGAEYKLADAEKIECTGDVYALKLRAISCDFADFSRAGECADVADFVKKLSSDERKKQLADMAAPLKTAIEVVKKDAEKLNAENEEKKSARREVFAKRHSSTAKAFGITAAAFAALLVLAVVFATMIYSNENGVFIIVTAVFGALAACGFIGFLITAHKFWTARRNLLLNEKNSSTKLGRAYEEKNTLLQQLTRIYAAIKQD